MKDTDLLINLIILNKVKTSYFGYRITDFIGGLMTSGLNYRTMMRMAKDRNIHKDEDFIEFAKTAEALFEKNKIVSDAIKKRQKQNEKAEELKAIADKANAQKHFEAMSKMSPEEQKQYIEKQMKKV